MLGGCGGGGGSAPGFDFGANHFIRLESGVLVAGVPSLDAFGRTQIWFTGASGIVRLGANTSDGDAFDMDSEGQVIYFPSANQAARIKADRFGLTRALNATLYYWRVDGTSFFYRGDPPGGRVHLYINRASGQIGVGTDTPNANSDVDIADGSVAYRRNNLICGAVNDDLDIATAPRAVYYRITGPVVPFSITGFTGGSDGRMIIVRNATVQQLSIKNESLASAAANRIHTQTGASAIIGAGGEGGCATLIYDPDELRWMVTAVQG